MHCALQEIRAARAPIKAKIEGGVLDGLDVELQEPDLELLVEDMTSGCAVVHRYVLFSTDERGVRHYYHQWRGLEA
jgi:hypothetical protein